MKKVFLYAGQGSQRVGMGLDFYETYPVYREMADRLDPTGELKNLMHKGPLETLSQTEHTQACMAVFAAGVTALLKEDGIEPEAACGLSLGEYGALHAAGVLGAEDYVKLLTFRGRVMAEAAREAGIQTAMSAVLGSDGAVIGSVCQEVREAGGGYVTIANYNCPGQIVICGEESGVASAEEKLKALGVKRCVRLNVSGPFHTAYMKPAGDALADYFKTITWNPVAIPVAVNATGSLLGTQDVAELLVKQVQSSVYLEQNLTALLEAGYTDFVEIGPGNTMAGFLKKTARALGIKIQVSSIDSVADFQKL